MRSIRAALAPVATAFLARFFASPALIAFSVVAWGVAPGLEILGASAVAQEAGPNPIQALEDCVLAQAKRLEVSGEAANIVAEASVANCGKQLTGATPSSNVLRSNIEARIQLKDAMRESALVQVVEDRAAAHAPPAVVGPVATESPPASAKPKPKPKPKSRTKKASP